MTDYLESEAPEPEKDAEESHGVDRSTPPVKARILQRFEAWLDEALAEESLPDGIASEILSEIENETSLDEEPRAQRVGDSLEPIATGVPPSSHQRERTDFGEPPSRKEADLYSLWASVTALNQEVRLQGRAFKGLNDSLSPFLEWVSASQDRAVREAERRVRRESLVVLVDLRDRLARGADTASERLEEVVRAAATDWTDWLFRRRSHGRHAMLKAVEALEQGYRMSLDRLGEALDRLGVREIDCEGQVFDPHCMTAVDVEETREVDEGEVVEVYRTGYEWNGEVFRAAEVKVARAPRPREQGGET